MAYIDAEQVADIRARLKEAFPAKDGWKLSVRKDGHLAVEVRFLKGPHAFKAYDFDKYDPDPDAPKCRHHAEAMGKLKTVTNGGVNQYWIADHYTADSAAILQKAYDIIARDHWDKSDPMTDYFNCAFYIHLGIGTYERPYEYTPGKGMPRRDPEHAAAFEAIGGKTT